MMGKGRTVDAPVVRLGAGSKSEIEIWTKPLRGGRYRVFVGRLFGMDQGRAGSRGSIRTLTPGYQTAICPTA